MKLEKDQSPCARLMLSLRDAAVELALAALKIDENYRLGPRRPTDINRQLDEISRDLAYVDTLLAELWLLLLRYKQTSVYHFGDFLPSKKTSDLASVYHSQPINDTCPQPADFPPGNEELECLWLSEDSDGPCSHRFENRKDFIDHLNRSHEVNGTAKRKIPCRWLLGPHDLSTFTLKPPLRALIPGAENVIPVTMCSRGTSKYTPIEFLESHDPKGTMPFVKAILYTQYPVFVDYSIEEPEVDASWRWVPSLGSSALELDPAEGSEAAQE
ncbi:hypothetical protein BKA82DRAFT_21301 [Pisolithus tinctorius]|uniref:Uncharacterized protein n=1 Tax=Pisolithus tinctorius Marx 270 TaxID=870435 RepID=A0A0C3KL85_PISTI|nr:hypothetical protein BKA82DRAFT_21301 [Pisolithus tinctorius]KIO10337.1 hypothetical protein M404DRAFT_21301 [Pisolithus tinctorius Marx 270]